MEASRNIEPPKKIIARYPGRTGEGELVDECRDFFHPNTARKIVEHILLVRPDKLSLRVLDGDRTKVWTYSPESKGAETQAILYPVRGANTVGSIVS